MERLSGSLGRLMVLCLRINNGFKGSLANKNPDPFMNGSGFLLAGVCDNGLILDLNRSVNFPEECTGEEQRDYRIQNEIQ